MTHLIDIYRSQNYKKKKSKSEQSLWCFTFTWCQLDLTKMIFFKLDRTEHITHKMSKFQHFQTFWSFPMFNLTSCGLNLTSNKK